MTQCKVFGFEKAQALMASLEKQKNKTASFSSGPSRQRNARARARARINWELETWRELSLDQP